MEVFVKIYKKEINVKHKIINTCVEGINIVMLFLLVFGVTKCK